LLPFGSVEVFEKLDEPPQEIAFGEEQVHGKHDPQPPDQLIHPGADLLGVSFNFLVACLEQVGNADGGQHAVDRAPLSPPLEQVQKRQPLTAVLVFGDVAASGVQ
jgi:hypothetical protein